MCSAATAVMRNQLLPIDGIADAGKPFEERCSDMLRSVGPTSARGPCPDAILPGRSALEHVLGGKLVGGHCHCIVRDCGHSAVHAPPQVPLANAFSV